MQDKILAAAVREMSRRRPSLPAMRKPPFLWDELDVTSVAATLREAIEAEFFAPDAESGFRPFDRVLVRHDDGDIWTADWFSHVERGDYATSGGYFAQCVRFEGNERLVGTRKRP